MLTRREFLERTAMGAATTTLLPAACGRPRPASPPAGPLQVNDVHSQLNRTRVLGIARPDSVESLQEIVRSGRVLSIAGGRHAMGGQQFGSDTILVDMSGMSQVIEFDPERGQIEVGAGMQWPALVDYLLGSQSGARRPWGIIQKQTGADRLSLGGALAANAHGRGLTLQPIVGDVQAFSLVDADGVVRRCSRSENVELFRLALGGYGLFGVIATVRLRLAPRRKVQRIVEVIDVDALPSAFDRRIADGFQYGDFQYSTDLASDEGLRRGVFSCYRPVDDATPIPDRQQKLAEDDWGELIYLAHTDRAKAFRAYASYYRSTSGQVYWSDTHQMSTYVDDYHRALVARMGAEGAGTEMITEIYVPRDALVRFLEEVRQDLRAHDVNLIYGTVRLIERDDETVLAWARERWACVIFNLHVRHDAAGIEKAARDFRRLIDRGRSYGGSYFLTYHRWASREQVVACHPRFVEFLRAKRRLDPGARFQSDWYRHYRDMFADEI